MTDGPLTREGLRVCRARCSTCIFRPGNLMELRPGRVSGMVAEAVANDGCIPCHKTLNQAAPVAVCRGFYDKHGTRSLLTRLAYAEMVAVVLVDADAGA